MERKQKVLVIEVALTLDDGKHTRATTVFDDAGATTSYVIEGRSGSRVDTWTNADVASMTLAKWAYIMAEAIQP